MGLEVKGWLSIYFIFMKSGLVRMFIGPQQRARLVTCDYYCKNCGDFRRAIQKFLRFYLETKEIDILCWIRNSKGLLAFIQLAICNSKPWSYTSSTVDESFLLFGNCVDVHSEVPKARGDHLHPDLGGFWRSTRVISRKAISCSCFRE